MRIKVMFAVAALACATGCAKAPEPAPAPAAVETPPLPGHPGKDVIWVPTPPSLVEKMLDMAGITSKDFVMDLGSGDGRIVIAAAKRGARALGVEFTPELVAMSRRNAAAAGVGGRAEFVQGDMYEADLSQASALALFLLPVNLQKLVPKFLTLPPGTPIVNNGYRIPGWEEKEIGVAGDCGAWCTAYLYVVPAQASGTWRLGNAELVLEQEFQVLSGTLGGQKVEGALSGERIRLTSGLDVYTGRVRGDQMSGEASGSRGGYWSAVRQKR